MHEVYSLAISTLLQQQQAISLPKHLQITHCRLEDNADPLCKAIANLKSSPQISLSITHCTVSSSWLANLSDAISLHSEIDLGNCHFQNINISDFVKFFNLYFQNQSQKLTLTNCGLGANFFKAILQTSIIPGMELHEVNLAGNNFSGTKNNLWTEFLKRISKLKVQKLNLESCHLCPKFFTAVAQFEWKATAKMQELNLSNNNFLDIKRDMWVQFFKGISNLNARKLNLKSCKLPVGFFFAVQQTQMEANLEELNLSDNNLLDVKQDVWVQFFRGILSLNIQKLNLRSCKLPVGFFAAAAKSQIKTTIEMEDPIDWSGSDFSDTRKHVDWIFPGNLQPQCAETQSKILQAFFHIFRCCCKMPNQDNH